MASEDFNGGPWRVIGIDPAICPTMALVEGVNRDDLILHDIKEGPETCAEAARFGIPRDNTDARRLVFGKEKKKVMPKKSRGKTGRKKAGIKEPYPPFIRQLFHDFAPDMVVIENAWVMPGQGVASSASFVGAARMIEGIAHGMGLPLLIARPIQWQPWFQVSQIDEDDVEPYTPDPLTECASNRAAYAARKERSRHMAARIFYEARHMFDRKMDHNRAEACLLAVYGLELLHIYHGDLTKATAHGFVNRQRLNLHYKDEEVVAL